MHKTADAVIIGGGIIGLAVAFYLAREKFGKITILEKERFLGSGATSKAAGGIRAQFSNEVNISMSMLSEKLFCRFKEDTGYDALFDQVGYMFLLSDEGAVKEFRKSYDLQRSLGLKVELVQPKDIPKLAPHVKCDDLLLATYCPDDGLGDPHEFLSGYEHAIRRLGVDIEMESGVTGFLHSESRLSGVKTSKGEISSPLIINCAGPFAGEIGKLAGVDIPVKPYPRQCVTTGELDFVKSGCPMVVDTSTGFYCHKESKGLLLGWADKATESTFDISINPDYTDNILERALARIPLLETAEIANQWAGLYETTPDHQAIIGFEPDIEGLFHVTGFSGHGFMQAPAAGMVTAEIIIGKKTTVDITALRPGRFKEGVIVEETNVI